MSIAIRSVMLHMHIHLTFQLLAIIIHQKPFYDSNKGFLSSPWLSNELCSVMMYHTNQPFLHSVLCSLLSLRDPLSHALKWGFRPNRCTLEIYTYYFTLFYIKLLVCKEKKCWFQKQFFVNTSNDMHKKFLILHSKIV